jgi:hypothetical protein
MVRFAVTVASLLVSLGSMARAQGDAFAAVAHGAPAQLPQLPQPEPELRSPALAFALSAAGAAAALYVTAEGLDRQNDALLYAGAGLFVLGPSAGNFYSDRVYSPGLLMRVLGVGAYAGAVAWSSRSCHQIDGICGGPFLLGMLGISGVAAGTVGDLAEARQSAHAYNRAHSTLTMLPTVYAAAGGPAAGFAISGSF